MMTPITHCISTNRNNRNIGRQLKTISGTMSVIDKISSAEAFKQAWNIKAPTNYPERVIIFELFFQKIFKQRGI